MGAAVGAQLPAPFASGVMMALVLALFGALVSSALPRVRDWQVALMSPFVGAATGATIGWSLDTFTGASIGVVAGIGFGLLALPPLVLITDGARRAIRLPRRSLLGRAQRRRVWLLALSTSSLAALVVPALANPWSRPSEAPLAQLCAVATMMVALVDAMIWVHVAQISQQSAAQRRPSSNPYRESAAPKPPAHDLRMLGVLAAESLLYDALLVAVVAAALLVSR
ncbi:MAG: hypothetical protein JWM53_2702 [bacterium]|nr:hypothetical protein [bacterium]